MSSTTTGSIPTGPVPVSPSSSGPSSAGASSAGAPFAGDAFAGAGTSPADLARQLVDAWGSWGPNMTPDADRMAFISDRSGIPEVWVQDVPPAGEPVIAPLPEPRRIRLSDDPVVSVRWSADSAWLAVAVATDGGVRTQVWVVRPDGSGARLLAGNRELHAELGPWSRSGHRVVVTIPSTGPGVPSFSYLADPTNGELHPLAAGDLITVLDLSVEERLVILRDGQRGHQFCVVVDRVNDIDHPLIPESPAGATDAAILRPAPEGEDLPLVAYVVTDAGLPRRQLLSMPLGPNGWRGKPVVLAERDDAELEALDADDRGRLLMLVWNVGGSSELELLDTITGASSMITGMPGRVASSPVLSRDGGSVILSIEGPTRPRELWRVDTASHEWTRVADGPRMPDVLLIEPTLESFTGLDGLPLSGWLYRARTPGGPTDSDLLEPSAVGSSPSPAMLSLHGGPEAQERPTFSPQHQALAAAGITVFAPNVRGSSGFGRDFVHADDVERRQGAFDDVTASAQYLVRSGIADASRIAVTGRSYGGYLTLAALAFTPEIFAAGVDICGMSDLHTFYRDTEPWIGAAAYSKYGHPRRHRKLLKSLSPLRRVRDIRAPLLVVHGELDTNVPIGEAKQIVAALTRRGRSVDYLELAGEGHEYRRAESRVLLIERMLHFLVGTLHVRSADTADGR